MKTYLKVISKIKEINKICNTLKYFMKKFLGMRKTRISKSSDNWVLSRNLKFVRPRIMPSKPRDPISINLMLIQNILFFHAFKVIVISL
jgi:hypothetical protein